MKLTFSPSTMPRLLTHASPICLDMACAALPVPLKGRRQRGFGVIAAIMVMVVLASLAAAVMRMSWSQQIASGQDIQSAQAFQAANAGTEWGMFQVLNASGTWRGASCVGATQNIDMRSTHGVMVTVTCNTQSTPFFEGQDSSGADRQLRVYRIIAVACNSTTSCPDNTAAGNFTYVERQREAVVTSDDPVM